MSPLLSKENHFNGSLFCAVKWGFQRFIYKLNLVSNILKNLFLCFLSNDFMEEFVVYILYSESHNIHYTGFTSNLIERFHSHNKYSTKGFTYKYRPWTVVYVEFFTDKKTALSREKFLKSGAGRNYLKSFLSRRDG